MKHSAWMRGLRNAAFCGVGVVPVLGGTAWLISSFSERSLSESMLLGGSMIFFFLLILMILRSWYKSYKAGPLLLDCGPVPMRWVLLFCTCVSTVCTVLAFLLQSRPFETMTPWFYLSMAVFQGYMALGRLQFRKAGLWQVMELMTWDRVESWRWKDGPSPSLVIQVKTRFPGFNQCVLPIPLEHRDWAEAFLQEHCPTAKHRDVGDPDLIIDEQAKDTNGA